jgi:D-erythro-7,8-dihydroneopterin triphosphate epimerase
MNKGDMDKIHIRDLLVRCIVGIYPEERGAKQDVIINITLYTDCRAAGRSDCIEDTVNYKAVKKKVLRMAEESQFYLIEKMAEAIAAICLEDTRVVHARVMIDKPGALRFARSVAVEIERNRGTHDDSGAAE